MDKHEYIISLFNDIKNNIELDGDVEALKILLSKLLEFDVDESFNCWKYIIVRYDIKEQNRDIDFLPLLKEYPKMLLDKIGLEFFFQKMRDIPSAKLQFIYQFLFNIYDANSYIYQSLDYYIKQNKYQDEKKLIDIFLGRKTDFFRGFFDQTEFIKRVILLHLETKNVSVDFLHDLIGLIDNVKDKAVLKTLIIDYI